MIRSIARITSLDGGRLALQELRRGEPGAPKLLCFAYAGGGPMAFRALLERLPSSYGVWAVDFPGHVRTRGEPLASIEAMVAECMRFLPMDLLTTTIFVGYSVGGYVAHALAAALERRGHVVPGVVLAASTPPSIRAQSATVSDLDSDALFEWLVSLGQRANPELFEAFEPAIRADLQAYDSYWPMERISAPALVLGGDEDPLASPEELEAWASLTESPEIEILPGGHFFLDSAPRAMADAVGAFAERLARGITGEVRMVSSVSGLSDGDDDDVALIA